MIVNYPLDGIWPIVAPRIEQIKNRGGDLIEWTLQDVYQAIAENRAFLFNDSESECFAVVYTKNYGDRKTLFIWIGYSESGKRERSEQFLKEIARNVNASRMEMESCRKGFDRTDWIQGMTTYVMEV